MKKIGLLLLIALVMCSSVTYANNDREFYLNRINQNHTSIKEEEKVIHYWDEYFTRYSTYNYTIPIPIYQQATNYYCGPASVKMVVQFINGSSDTQNVIAGDLNTNSSGTYVYMITKYLNDKTSKNYNHQIFYSPSSWFNAARAGVMSNKPMIANVKSANSPGVLPYTTSGHYMPVSGVAAIDVGGVVPYSNIVRSAPAEYIRVTDPWGVALGHRWYKADLFYGLTRGPNVEDDKYSIY